VPQEPGDEERISFINPDPEGPSLRSQRGGYSARDNSIFFVDASSQRTDIGQGKDVIARGVVSALERGEAPLVKHQAPNRSERRPGVESPMMQRVFVVLVARPR
jgi:hypothetical protein